MPELQREAARATGAFAAADAELQKQRDAVKAAQNAEAHRLKAQKRAAADTERRAQVCAASNDGNLSVAQDRCMIVP